MTGVKYSVDERMEDALKNFENLLWQASINILFWSEAFPEKSDYEYKNTEVSSHLNQSLLKNYSQALIYCGFY